MKRLRVSYSAAATSELLEISSWIAEASGSPRTGRRYVERIREQCRRVGLAPFVGQVRDELGSDLRSRSFEGTATIFYRVEAGRVVVVRILRAGRDVERAFTP